MKHTLLKEKISLFNPRNMQILLGFLFVAIFTVFSVLPTPIASAGGAPTEDGGNVGAMCYDPGSGKAQLIWLESAIEACRSVGMTVVQPGEPVPVAICADSDSFQQLGSNESERTACRSQGWTVAEVGQPMPGIVVAGSNSSSSSNAPAYKENDCTQTDISASNCGILGYLVIFINVLSALAGIVIIGSIIYAGILYSASGSDPQKVSAAKDRIRNAFIALIFFIFGYALLNYLVPGGVL